MLGIISYSLLVGWLMVSVVSQNHTVMHHPSVSPDHRGAVSNHGKKVSSSQAKRKLLNVGKSNQISVVHVEPSNESSSLKLIIKPRLITSHSDTDQLTADLNRDNFVQGEVNPAYYSVYKSLKRTQGRGSSQDDKSFQEQTLNTSDPSNNHLNSNLKVFEAGARANEQAKFHSEVMIPRPILGSKERGSEGKVPKWVGRRQSAHQYQEDVATESFLDPTSMELENSLGRKSPAIVLDLKKHQKSYIRHRKSRKTFVRTRKSPKMRQRSHVYDYEDLIPTSKEDYPVEDVSATGLGSRDKTRTPASRTTELDDGKYVISPQKLVFQPDFVQAAWNDSQGDLVPDDQLASSGVDGSKDFETYTETSNLAFEDNRDSVDVVTKFLRIIESQQSMGANCTKGTQFNLGEGVVDRYAQERFRQEAEVAVNRANLYTRLWKYSRQQVLASEYLLHAEVLSLVEFDEDIFAAGNCYDYYQYQNYELFCPFAHRIPGGKIRVKDLALEYYYLSNGSEFFLDAKRSAERVIENYTQIQRGFHSFTWNLSSQPEPMEEEILYVRYEDGIWSKPYFDCGGGDIWMMTYTVPFFGFQDSTYFFKGTSGIDVDLRRVDIDQCPLPPGSTALNIFAASDKCKHRTTKCASLPGLGFRRGSYKCLCRDGFYFPDTEVEQKYYNGSTVEEEYEKILLNQPSLYDRPGMFECLACAPGCETCEDGSPCVVSLNWVMRTAVLVMALVLIACLPAIAFLTWKYGNVKVVRAASPALLRFIILGASFIYCTSVVQYPIPNVVTCSLRVWLREIGFSLTYGALMLKTWRISVVFRVRSAKAVKITDLNLLKRLGLIVAGFSTFLAIRTIVAPPHVIVSYTTDGLKAFLCSTDWWDHVFTAMEMSFLVWGIRLCIVVRKAPSEFNESKFISMAIYNEFLLTLFLNVSMLFLRSPANPDLLFIIYFSHTQLTVTLLLALIFGSKAYMVVKGQCKEEESISMTKPNTAAKLHHKSKNNSACMASVSSSIAAPTDGDVQEEFHRVYLQLEALKERNIRLNNRHLVARITAMQEAATAMETDNSHDNKLNDTNHCIVKRVTDDNKMILHADNQDVNQNKDIRYCSNMRSESNPTMNRNSGFPLGCETFTTKIEIPMTSIPSWREGRELTAGGADDQASLEQASVCALRYNSSDEDVVKPDLWKKSSDNISRRRSSKSFTKRISRNPLSRCKSHTGGRLSDGIVMKPIINSIWPKATDSMIITSNCSSGVHPTRSIISKSPSQFSHTLSHASDKDATVQTSYSNQIGKENSTQTSNVDRFLSSSTAGILADNLRRLSMIDHIRTFSYNGEEERQVFHSHSSFSHEYNPTAAESPIQRKHSYKTSLESVRLYHSLGTLDDSLCSEREGMLDMDTPSRSAQSTPRQTSRLRMVRDPDKARAFILYSLADRAKVTGEVTV